MQTPHHYRKEIPFFHEKTEAEFRDDVYEKYDEMVTKQTALHLADDLWNGYPMQTVLDFVTKHLQMPENANIAEIGCSVGRLIGNIAQTYPESQCWALDYSYQLLKRAKEFWIDEITIHLDASIKGFKTVHLQRKALKNLRLGLAKAEALPFDTKTQDVVISSFLLDRLQDPLKAIAEMHRVLKKGGQMIMITPLNFTKMEHWQQLYPVPKINSQFINLGFSIETMEENQMIVEPLDVHGNVILWKCLMLTCRKN